MGHDLARVQAQTPEMMRTGGSQMFAYSKYTIDAVGMLIQHNRVCSGNA